MERGMHELYGDDPERAAGLLWGQRTTSRRQFLRHNAVRSLAFALGASLPFGHRFPGSLIPAAFAQGDKPFEIEGKEGLRVLNDRPLNAETLPHFLDDEVTPTNRLFIRNNGLIPEIAKQQDASDWQLYIDGEVEKPLTLSMQDLKTQFANVTMQLILECAGNGRAAYYPKASGNQWTYGAIGCPMWTGVRLKDVLEAAGVRRSAVYTAYYGLDIHPSGDLQKTVISRGTPMAKALEETTLLAFAMNGEPLSPYHGFPVRLVCPGYPGSASGKWLKRIWIRDQIHDGPKMTGSAYRMPQYPVAPGTNISDSDMKIIEQMPVKSLITFPESGTEMAMAQRQSVTCRGSAWTGSGTITAVHVSYDFGQTWVSAKLSAPRNAYAWQRWEAQFALPSKGYYEIWARATDSTGTMQPMVVPGWNPKGYLNNAAHRIAVMVV
jgi:DMSO/TMAO reductase YedYZ molybdopterin-dependent catalytic subunit